MTATAETRLSRGQPRESGLDTSNGLEFVQRRIGLFAGLIAVIGLAFLIVGFVGSRALNLQSHVSLRPVTHVAGLVLLTAIWMSCRWRRFSLAALERLDATALIGSCTVWAFFIEPPVAETIQGAGASVMMTVLTRAILVPSKAARTLRLTIAAVLPVTIFTWALRPSFQPDGPGATGSAV
ncbi:MAG TPA: hypothetical protein VF424_14385, partial [Vicinamibacterales bacterium]